MASGSQMALAFKCCL